MIEAFIIKTKLEKITVVLDPKKYYSYMKAVMEPLSLRLFTNCQLKLKTWR